MVKTLFSSWPLFLGMTVLMLGNGLQGSLLGVRASIENFPTTVTGLVMSAFYLGLLFGSMMTPRFIARVGHIRVFAAFAAIASASVLVHPIVAEPVIWAVLRAITGFSFAGLYIVAESWLNAESSNRDRGQILSLYMLFSWASMAGGQLLLNVADPGGFVLFTVVSVLVSIDVVPMLLYASPAPTQGAGTSMTLRELFRASPLGLFGSFSSGFISGALFSLGAVYGRLIGLDLKTISFLMAAVVLAAMVFQWPLGWLSDRLDRRQIMISTALLATLAGVAGALIAGSLAPFSLVVIAAFSLPLYSIAIAHTNDYLDTEQIVAASSGLMMANGIGAVAGPLVASSLMDILGPPGLPLTIGGIGFSLVCFGLYRMSQREAKPIDEQGPSVLVGTATPVATRLAQEAATEYLETSDADSTDHESAPLARPRAELV
ncbi:MAG: MFS transporter [Geminicoccaceae bacterium]